VAQPSGDELLSGMGSCNSFTNQKKHQMSEFKHTPQHLLVKESFNSTQQAKKKVHSKKKQSPFKVNDFIL